MRQKAEYSDKYGCNIQFNCGGEPISKTTHGLNNKDIDGAQPKRFTSERARPSPDLSLDPNNRSKITEGRSQFRAPAQPRNPLAPEYDLPPLPPPPEVEAQKFIRDTLDVSDIPGSKVRVPKKLEKPYNALKNSDIEGSQPGGGGGGVATHHYNHSVAGSTTLKPRNDMRMDVSDIVTKTKQPVPRKEQENLVSEVDDGLGKSGIGAQRKKEYFDSLRKHGSDVTRARAQAQNTLLAAVSAKTTISQNRAALNLETQFREIDKHNSGLIKPKEFEIAIQNSGLDISKAKVQEVSKALGDASSSGMVAYQDVLTHLYDYENIESSSASSAAAAAVPAADRANNPAAPSTTQPQWYLSRQRRVKTEVAICMGQQPQATAASAANVETPQERASRHTRATGKKIQGLSRPGEGAENVGSSDSAIGKEIKESYWFADYQKPTDTPVSNTKNPHGRGGDGGGGKSELWFSKDGEDAQAMKEMGLWRPTKDASIGIDFAKRMNKTENTRRGSGDGGGEGNEGPPPPKPPVAKAKPAPSTRKDRQMAEKDVERVRQLD